MEAGLMIYGIRSKLLCVRHLVDDLLVCIPENDGATWAALVTFRAALGEAMEKWARVVGEES